MTKVEFELNSESQLTDQEIAMIHSAASLPYVYDEDAPELAEEQIAELHRMQFIRKRKCGKQTLQPAARAGWLPKKWAVENSHGIPVRLLGIFYIMGAVPILTGMDITIISNMGVGTDMLTSIILLLACWNLPKYVPEEWNKSRFHMSDRALHVTVIIMFILQALSSYVSFADLDGPSLIGCAIYIAVLLVYVKVRSRSVDNKE